MPSGKKHTFVGRTVQGKLIIPPVPTTLPLGTPTLYFSGISLADGGEWSQMSFDNSWTWYALSSRWLSNYGTSLIWNSNGGNKWTYKIRGLWDFGGGTVFTTRVACTNSAPAGDLPLFGWVNEPWVTAGTLVISTTP
jgi:hypothetical protein